MCPSLRDFPDSGDIETELLCISNHAPRTLHCCIVGLGLISSHWQSDVCLHNLLACACTCTHRNELEHGDYWLQPKAAWLCFRDYHNEIPHRLTVLVCVCVCPFAKERQIQYVWLQVQINIRTIKAANIPCREGKPPSVTGHASTLALDCGRHTPPKFVSHLLWKETWERIYQQLMWLLIPMIDQHSNLPCEEVFWPRVWVCSMLLLDCGRKLERTTADTGRVRCRPHLLNS